MVGVCGAAGLDLNIVTAPSRLALHVVADDEFVDHSSRLGCAMHLAEADEHDVANG